VHPLTYARCSVSVRESWALETSPPKRWVAARPGRRGSALTRALCARLMCRLYTIELKFVSMSTPAVVHNGLKLGDFKRAYAPHARAAGLTRPSLMALAGRSRSVEGGFIPKLVGLISREMKRDGLDAGRVSKVAAKKRGRRTDEEKAVEAERDAGACGRAAPPRRGARRALMRADRRGARGEPQD
jgi:hypothetical protein